MEKPSVEVSAGSGTDESKKSIDEDEALLLRMGYKQDLYRGFNGIMSMMFCYTAVAVVSSITGLLTTALATGGPVVLVWSWIACASLTIIVSLNLAEICSTYPSAGSVYYWAGALAPDSYSSLLSYITGWFNFIGNAAADAFFAYAFAAQVDGMAGIYGHDPLSVGAQVGIGIGVAAAWALLNMLRVDQQGWINVFSGCLQLATAIAIILLLFISCSTADYEYYDYGTYNTTTVSGTASSSQVFTTFYNQTGMSNTGYVVLIGLLTSLYSFTGYEAAAHMSEETRHASKTAPWGILNTSFATAATGFGLILALLYATSNQLDNVYYNGISVIGVFQQCAGTAGAAGMGVVLIVVMFLNGYSSMTVTTRIAFAMARDEAFPLSRQIAYISKSTQAPMGAVVLIFILDSLLVALNLVNTTAFTAVTAVATIGYQISYAIPILLRITCARKTFRRGHFHLGRYGVVLGWISVIFLNFTSCLFVLPVEYPVTAQNMNYTCVVVMGIVFIAAVTWIVHAQFHFVAPHKKAVQDVSSGGKTQPLFEGMHPPA